MCNAWNHSSTCPCGWGGVGHKGRATISTKAFSFWPRNIPPIIGDVRSFSVPNASCPVCGATVFYYCNDYGSSVFFDEPGPPWSKHPCTDKGKQLAPKALTKTPLPKSDHFAKWERAGWKLATPKAIVAQDKYIYKVHVSLVASKVDRTLYVTRQTVPAEVDIEKLVHNKFIFVKELSETYIKISVLNTKLKELEFPAYNSRIAISEQMDSRNRGIYSISQKLRKSRGNRAAIGKNVKSTAMKDAFVAAGEHENTKRVR